MDYKRKKNLKNEPKLGFHCARQYMSTYFWSMCILMTNHKAAYTPFS